MLTSINYLWGLISVQRFLIKYHSKMSYKRRSTKRQIEATLDYFKALAEEDYKPKDYVDIWTEDSTDK